MLQSMVLRNGRCYVKSCHKGLANNVENDGITI